MRNVRPLRERPCLRKHPSTQSLSPEVAAASRDVYAAWTEPEKMERWLGKVSAEARIGGRYRFESPAEGRKTNTYTGEYLVLEDGRRVVQSFLAGEPDPTAADPYPNEFIEIRLRDLGPSRTAVTFINWWDGEAISDEFLNVARTAWSEWLDRMEKSVLEGA